MKKTSIIISIPVLVGYFLIWGVAYVLVMLSRGDRPSLRECYEYFLLAWAFQAGELPGFIWLVSVIGFTVVGGVLSYLLKR